METSLVSKDRLVWMRRDIERQFGFSGSRFTRVGSLLPALIAIAVTVGFFGGLFAIGSNPWVDMFTRRGWTPFVIVFFALWSAMILWLKRSKLGLQRRALRLNVIPDHIEHEQFALSVETAEQVLHRLYQVSDDPKHFVLLHRIEVGLSNVRSLSHVGDLGEILRTQSEHDESVMETSFNLIRGLVWAIPILGFIGTVSGLSSAIGGFGRVLSQTDDPAQLIDALKGVTGGLATAFETTLLALIAALLVQMAMTFQKKREEEFLDECTEYCQREISSRLRTDGSSSAAVALPKPSPKSASRARVPETKLPQQAGQTLPAVTPVAATEPPVSSAPEPVDAEIISLDDENGSATQPIEAEPIDADVIWD
ncbi:MotA/TolQ/ExbB proton channel family protein [Stieleria varia]|uniref:MotA/TolQ/ExbB proton channel family protein n=1 Tax=Stieleria varia TaxID=2528005 RepID=A0A5C6B2R4_9BACT|nr:MotA/TolQ/ExbB proton channel family protein [Stieleria varia]TWU05762.1 MotA/TolQ/ExbB proton channel family protein [Stieleria varia]